jgi:PLP dependent protein
MAFLIDKYYQIKKQLAQNEIALVAVTKSKPVEDITNAYDAGLRDFGENYAAEMIEKHNSLPKDIHWHFIGHLQTNKVKLIAPFVYMIHSIDSKRLLEEVNKQAENLNRTIPCLLQVHIAQEGTKFGFTVEELNELETGNYQHVDIRGLMGMATFTDDESIIRSEFKSLHKLFELYKLQRPQATILSMGMSSDYAIAIEEGTNMVRLGSILFGDRQA